ncbi:hypothetical protein Tco_1205632, partial [Tanacetum coccineum]
DFPDCEDSRARSIHKSFTSSASYPQEFHMLAVSTNVLSFGTLHKRP